MVLLLKKGNCVCLFVVMILSTALQGASLKQVPPVPQPPPGPLHGPQVTTQPSVQDHPLTIINSTTATASVRFGTSNNPGIVETIPAGGTKTVSYLPTAPMTYTLNSIENQAITPTMITNNIFTLKEPQQAQQTATTQTITTPRVKAATTPAAAVQKSRRIKPALASAPRADMNPELPKTSLPRTVLPPAASSQGPPGYKTQDGPSYAYPTMPTDKPRG